MVKKKKKNEPFKEFRSSNKTRYKTFKIPLKSILLDKTTQPKINDLVFAMNDLVVHTYQFIRLYILNLYNKKQDIPIEEKDDLFFRYCLKILNSSEENKGLVNPRLFRNLEEFYQTEYKALLNHTKPQITNIGHITNYLATQIHTSYFNNIKEHFVQHFLRFINLTTTDITKDKSVLYQFKNQLFKLEEKTDPIFSEWKKEHLTNIFSSKILNSKSTEFYVPYDVKLQPREYLKGMLYMNSILEKTDSKLFQPLPLRTNIISKYMVLDTAGIVDYFCPDVGIKKSTLMTKINLHKNLIWGSFLNLKHKIFRNKYYEFDNQIQTDGFGCSLLFIRKDLKGTRITKEQKLENSEKEYYYIDDIPKDELNKLKERNVVGCDPGKRFLVYMSDKQGNKLKYTACKKRSESKADKNQSIMLFERERNGIVKKETELSSKNSKVIDYQKFKDYLVKKNELNKQTTEFYKREVWRKMKFRQYSYEKKSVDMFLNRIEETFGKDTIIGYGNWSRSSQMKHFMPTMNKGLRKLIHKRYDTVSVDECNTSKKCCDCRKDLEYVSGIKNKKGKEVKRLQKCVSCENKRNVFRTRDLNSSTNIMKLTQLWIDYQIRPDEFKIKRLSPFCS